jgi:hypothetical protein
LIESGTLLLLLGLQNKQRVVEHLEITLQEFVKPNPDELLELMRIE